MNFKPSGVFTHFPTATYNTRANIKGLVLVAALTFIPGLDLTSIMCLQLLILPSFWAVVDKNYYTVCKSRKSVEYYQSYKVQVYALVYAAGNNSKLALFCLWILNLTDRDRYHLCFSFAKLYQPRVETSVKLVAKVSCSSTFAKSSCLSEKGDKTEIS